MGARYRGEGPLCAGDGGSYCAGTRRRQVEPGGSVRILKFIEYGDGTLFVKLYILCGLERLLPKLCFDYPEFKLSRNDTTRLKSTVRSLLHDGLITDEPSWEANWVGAVLNRRIIVSSITDAANNGCFNWDKINGSPMLPGT